MAENLKDLVSVFVLLKANKSKPPGFAGRVHHHLYAEGFTCNKSKDKDLKSKT